MKIRYETPTFHLIGDNVASSVRVSLSEWPFSGELPGRPSSVTVHDGGDHITSAAIDGPDVVLTFDAPFTGDNGGSVLWVEIDL